MTQNIVQSLQLIHVHPSKTNPRKRFDENELKQLADNVKTHGVLQPILVRIDPDPNKPAQHFEIVAGERRYRAAKLAGKEDIPAIVKPLSDVEVLEIQIIENMQRADMHPLEEAAGYSALMATTKYDAARIAERVGRSVRYVYDRVKLLNLIPEMQKHFLDGTITAGHAVLLARLSPADQEKALGGDPGDRWTGGSGLFTHENTLFDDDKDAEEEPLGKAVSVKELERWIATHVKFDRKNVDAMLFPATAAVIAQATEDKAKIIPITRSYRSSDDIRKADKERIYGEQAWKRADGHDKSKLCEYSVLGVIVDGVGYGEAFAVCVNKDKCKVHWASEIKERQQRAKATAKGGSSKARSDAAYAAAETRRDAELKRRQEQEQLYKNAVPAILTALAGAVKKAPTKATGLLASRVIERCADWDFKSAKAAQYVPVGKTAEDALRHAAFLTLTRNVMYRPDDTAKICKAFGLDLAAIVAGANPAVKGVCNKCRCTHTTPCDDGGQPCAWTDSTETLCTACVDKPKKRTAPKKPARKKKR